MDAFMVDVCASTVAELFPPDDIFDKTKIGAAKFYNGT